MFDRPTLVVTHSFPHDANDYRGRFIAEMLSVKSGAPVVVLTPDPESEGEERHGAVTIIRFYWRHGHLAGRRIYNPVDLFVFLKMVLIFVIRATKIVKMYHISSIFACWAIPGGLVGLLVKMLTGVPYEVWALGTDITKFRKIPLLLRTIFYFADRIYANSEFLGEQMRSVTRRRVALLPTRSSLPDPITPQNPITFPQTAWVVAFVGRLEAVKGIDIFLEIARRVRSQRVDIVFVVFGEGSLRREVMRATNEGIVQWAGQVSPAELASYARRIDVLCITSREESMPVVVWEFQPYCRILSFAVGDIARYLPPDAIISNEDDFVRKILALDPRF